MSFGRHGSGCNARVEEFWGNLQDMKKRGFNRNGVIKKVLGGVVDRRTSWRTNFACPASRCDRKECWRSVIACNREEFRSLHNALRAVAQADSSLPTVATSPRYVCIGCFAFVQ